MHFEWMKESTRTFDRGFHHDIFLKNAYPSSKAGVSVNLRDVRRRAKRGGN